MIKKVFILISIILVITTPFLFKKHEEILIPANPDDVIVVITPHNEALRSEYGRGFSEWYREKTGKTVTIDWRHIGGGREVARYVNTAFSNNFRHYWEKTLKKVWTPEINTIFAHLGRIDEKNATPEEFEVKQAFLDSDVGCGLDLLFGGGVMDHKTQSAKGYTVPSGLIKDHPEWFTNDTIPEFFAGDRLWDVNGCWIGGSLSIFGIIYNSDAIKAIGVEHPPSTWMDLADPRYIDGIAIVDPMKSSSTRTTYEMLIQQQMQIIFNRLHEDSKNSQSDPKQVEMLAIREGWMEGLKLIQKIVANGRYTTESSAQTVLDVANGNCPIGIATDFYGRGEKACIESRNEKPRFHFVFPRSGGSPSPDPISLYRGASHKALAMAFLEYILTLPGQKLLAFKTNTPGGPTHAPLCRAPILKTTYRPEYLQYHSDPSTNPFDDAGDFVYQEAWTKPVAGAIESIFKMAFLDPGEMLKKAWKRIQRTYKKGHRDVADRALKVLEDLHMLSYDKVVTEIMAKINSKDYLSVTQYLTEMADAFRNQYKKAYQIAKGR